MSAIRYLIPALLVPAAIGGTLAVQAAGDGASGRAAAPMTCEIRINETAFGLEVEPVALSTTSSYGEYEFVVTKKSKGGNSVSSQSGDFETVAGEATVLGSAIFDRGGTLRAELTVRWAGGVITCERRYPEV